MDLVCLDLEGVLIPEIWIAFAEETGIASLRATTRDIPDYNELMQQRLRILDENGLTLPEIQRVIGGLSPLEGAADFLQDLRQAYQVVILSDTFYEFAQPMMQQLAWPTLLCHRLRVSANGQILDYVLRQPDPKRRAVEAFKGLNYRIFAAGDSYNDTTMLGSAHTGFLFKAPDNVKAEFPQFRSTDDYAVLRAMIDEAAREG
ncbi:MAG: bifunctional phosphoserine phosphatase/homoserine phosphotransferase ThrH [Gammaproteobacteria bacterium]|nr:bifunctional phosphoserine phosphatase/homoserine phosphotransferase ThrH [Gammaproteobacteria bacterium]